ncbi:MAG TPA: AAA family ATPase [Candidatus Limnocylindrales bacterium]|nr:AAA family ATPase [Candidatus Limnocylindrales bacterium]
MRITKLSVRDFRRYREFEVPLAPGLTIVHGPNEAGKTTIQRALELVLTRKATAGGAEIDGFRSWDATDDARPVIAIDFETDDDNGNGNGSGPKHGSVVKEFRGQKGTVRLEVDGQVITDPTLADQALAELTGIPTEAFFRSTASIRHHELADLDRDEAALRDRLQASISGADRGTSRAKKRLEKAIFELRTQGAKNPGRLKVAEEHVERERGFVEQGEQSLAQLERDRDTLSAAKDRRAEIDSHLVERRATLEKARQAERLAAERGAAQERFERYRTAVKVADELAKLHASHPSANPLPVLEQTVGRLRTLDTRIRELKAALAGEVEVQFEVPPPPTWRPLSRWAVALVVVGLLLAGITFALRFAGVVDLGDAPLMLGGAIAGIGFILAFVAWWLRRNDRMQTELRDVEIDRRLRGRSEMEEELKHCEADTEQQLTGIGLADLAAAEDVLAAEQEHVARIDRLKAQLEGLVGHEPADALPDLRDTAALEIEQKSHALEALGPIAREPRARERLEVEVRDLESALERARDDEANARARLEANAVDAEAVAAHAEALATWTEELAARQRQARVYERTLREIETAEQATMKTATRYLEQRMVADIARVTEGRYRRVEVDDRTFDIRVHAPERGDWVDVTQLSQGTLDLVYLVARIGLVRLVTGDRRPPLILDDPFVTFDDERARRALQLLRDVAKDFQVIYLTTSDRYDTAADAVVLLAGPTERDDAADTADAADGVGSVLDGVPVHG